MNFTCKYLLQKWIIDVLFNEFSDIFQQEVSRFQALLNIK